MKKIAGSAEADGIIEIDKEPFHGNTFVTGVEENVILIASDLYASNESGISFKPAQKAAPVFVLSYVTEANSLAGDSIAKNTWTVNTKGTIVLASDQTRPVVVLKNGNKMHKIDICFSKNWLFAQLSEKKKERLDIALNSAEATAMPLTTSFLSNDFRVTDDIHKRVFGKDWNRIFLKASTMTLLESAIDRIVTDQQLWQPRKPRFFDRMWEVEKKLLSGSWDAGPDIKELARQFCIGESTLKRQFKAAFGRPIYDHYLFKKMEAAKLLLSDHSLTVAQVAYSMGYEKASPFIAAFKKHYQLSPGHFRILNID